MMQLSKVVAEGATSAVNFNAHWSLDSLNSAGGLRYRRRFMLLLPTSGLAEDLVFDAATSLQLQARHLVFNARANSAPESAQLVVRDQGLLVQLPIPRLISSVRFANSLSPGGKTTRLFRTDGDTISEEAVASHVNPVSKPGASPHGKAGATVQAQGQTAEETAAKQSSDQLQAHVIGTTSGGLPPGELGVTDARILVRLEDAGDFESLNTGSITEFNLTTGPENLRLSVRLPALGGEAFPLPTVFPLNQQVNAGGALQQQLSDLVRRLKDKLAAAPAPSASPPTLPDPLVVELDMESDAPCRFTISGFAVQYRLARESFPDGAPKQVLRFAGDGMSRQEVALKLPSPVAVTRAELRLSGGGPETAGGAAGTPMSVPLGGLLDAPGSTGLRVDPRRFWSSPLALEVPMLTRGLDLLLNAVQAETRLHLEIVADREGRPLGDKLASADALLSSPGRAQLARFVFAETRLLQPGIYWLLLHSRDGAAVWYLQNLAGLHALQGGGDGDGATVTDQSGVARWLAADGPAAAARRAPEITLDGQPLTFSIDDNELVYDLVPAIGGGATGIALLQQTLNVLASGPKPLTLYPPRLEFDIQA